MKLSVIVPTLNEAACIGALCTDPQFAGADTELIVSDGGSVDGTTALLGGATLVSGPPGRGQQLARGAAAATGDVLLFLHADTVLAPGALAAVREAMADPDVSGGNFRLIFAGGDAFAVWLTGFYARLRRRGRYYGDSAIFVRRRVYDAMGGLRPIALMEDYDFARRLERVGNTICIDTPPATTSCRRFAGRKRWRIVGQWILLHLLFELGASPNWLARLYRSRRHSAAGPG